MKHISEKGHYKTEALAFLKAHKTGVLATISPSGHPRARTIYYACDDSFSIYFVTLIHTRKSDDIKEHERAAFVISEEQIPQTLQLEGPITDLTETATIDPVLSDLTKVLMSNTTYFAPITRFDSAKILFFRLKPDWVRWGDFTKGQGTEEVLSPIYP